MKEKIEKLIKTPLIMSIIMLILGAILFTNPENIVMIVTYGFGGLFILVGVIKFINYVGDKKKGIDNNANLISAVVMIILGLIIILCTSMIELILRIVIGGFILYNGIIRVIDSLKLKDSVGSMWKGHMIVAIIMIIVGLYVILRSNLVFSTIGLFIMAYSLMEIILSIMSYKTNQIIIKK